MLARLPKTPSCVFAYLGRLLASRLFFLEFVVDGNLFQVIRFEDLLAIQTADIIDPIPAHQEFRARMFTARHSKLNIPILMMVVWMSSPFLECSWSGMR